MVMLTCLGCNGMAKSKYTIPPKPIGYRRIMENAAEKVLKDTANKEARSFRRTVQTWNEKPTFSVKKVPNGYEIQTDDIRYYWVNFGTKKHLIPPRGKNRGGADTIAYQKDFTPKTQPNRIGAKSGGKSGPMKIWPKGYAVAHPGIKPRRFDAQIVRLIDKRLADSAQKEINSQVKKNVK